MSTFPLPRLTAVRSFSLALWERVGVRVFRSRRPNAVPSPQPTPLAPRSRQKTRPRQVARRLRSLALRPYRVATRGLSAVLRRLTVATRLVGGTLRRLLALRRIWLAPNYLSLLIVARRSPRITVRLRWLACDLR